MGVVALLVRGVVQVLHGVQVVELSVLLEVRLVNFAKNKSLSAHLSSGTLVLSTSRSVMSFVWFRALGEVRDTLCDSSACLVKCEI